MSDRKKLVRRKKEVEEISQEEEKPSKLEYEVAKYLKNVLPEKKTILLRDKVDYFIASKAIDCLLDSKWATKKAGDLNDAVFTTRESVVDFLNIMLHHRFFHRAKKIIIKEKKKIKDKDSDDLSGDNEIRKKDKKKSGEELKKKEKIKVKLDIHMEQIIVDSNEPYVWIYDPISIWSWIFGFLLVFGVVVVCLFPLWPSALRDGVYYLSILAASFLITIMALALIKIILFSIIWCVTFGKHHFWLLPNLTEDVGFFASFWPLYYHKTSEEKLKEKEKEKEKAKSKLTKSSSLSVSTSKNGDKKIKKNLDKEEEIFEKKDVDFKKKEYDSYKQDNISDSSENDSLKNNGFELVDDKELPPILDLKL